MYVVIAGTPSLSKPIVIPFQQFQVQTVTAEYFIVGPDMYHSGIT